LAISSLGLISFFIGYLNKPRTVKNIANRKNLLKNNTNLIPVFLAYLFYFLFFISAGSYSSGEYSANDASALSSYFYKLFKISFSAAIIIRISYISSLEIADISFKKYLLLLKKPILILLSWFVVFSLFVGDRGPVIYFLTLSIALYFIRWKRFSFVSLFVLVIAGGFFMTLVGEIRQSRFSGASYKERVLESVLSIGSDENTKRYDTQVPGGQTIELASSVRTLNHAIYNVPKHYNYQYGLFQLRHIYSIVPGFSGILNRLIYDGEKKYDGSSNFITFLIQGENPTYGDGTSIVADFYLDFGVVGVVAGLYFFGFFIGRNEIKLLNGTQNPSLSWIALLIYFSLALYVNRSALLLEFGNIILIYLLIKLNSGITLPKKNKIKIG
jgi:hypothetical protein